MTATVMSDEAKALVEANLPLVGQVVRSVSAHYPRHADRDELMQAAALGLVEAACRFDASRGVPFERWAALRIRGAVVDAVRDRDIAPRGLRSAAREVEETRAALARDHGRTPTNEELARAVGISEAELNGIVGRAHRSVVLSLDAPVASAGGTEETLGASILDEAALQPVELLEQREQSAYLRDALSCLPERLRTIVSGYFLEGRSSAELAAELGVTESRVSQLRSEALTLMRHGLEAQYAETRRPAPAAVAGGRSAQRYEAYAAAVAERSTVTRRSSALPVPRVAVDGTPYRSAV